MKQKKVVYPLKQKVFRPSCFEENDNARFLHNMYFKYRRHYLKKAAGGFITKPFIKVWKWLWLEVMVKSNELIKHNGKVIKEETGFSNLRQHTDLVKTSLAIPCRPQDYYIFELYKPENKKRACNFIFRYEVKNVLYKMLIETDNIREISPLTNKGDFTKKARDAGLPIVPVICTIINNQVEYYDKPVKADLFAKALDGRGGRGAEVWYYMRKKNGFKKKKQKKYKLYSFEEIVEYYRGKSFAKPVIIQEKVKNHPEISDLACEAVSTCRVITMINEKNQPEVVTAVFRMAARKGKIVDNIHKGGIASPIDIESGVLGQATNLGIQVGLGRLSHHPVTGALIEGRKLPYWQEVSELAVHAHEFFRPRVIIGWDICLTDRGPVIIEGNAQPCVDLIQRPHNKPLSETRFGELMVHNLEKQYII